LGDPHTEIVDPLSGDDEIRQVLSSFAAAHQVEGEKPKRKAAVKKREEKPAPPVRVVERELEDEDEESEMDDDDESVETQFEGMASEDNTEDDDDGSDGLPPASRARKPKPDAGQKDDIWSWYEKFKIGVDPDMDIQIMRVYPKIFPNGVVAEGLLDTCPTPIDAEYVARTYGGGRYEIYAMGPGKGGHGRRRYSKYTLSIPGIANSAMPSSLAKDAIGKGDTRMQHPAVAAPPPVTENTSVTQQALKTLEKVSDDAQKRARTLEDRMYNGAASGAAEATKMADIVRDESDKRVQLLRDQAEREARYMREQSDREAKLLEQRLLERDRELEQLRGEVRQMQQAAPGTIREIVDMVRPNRQDGSISQEVMNSLLSKHATELEAMRAAHAREVEATRSAHLREIESVRQSNERDRDADRREAAAREARIADQLTQVREERRRDLEMHRQMQEQRDTASRDREQSRVELVDTMWQARTRSAEEAANFRIASLSAESERLRGELADLRSKAREDGDVYSQIEKAKQLLDVAREMGGGSSGGGGGLGSDIDLSPPPPPPPPPPPSKGVIDQVMEHGPMIAKIVGDLVGSDTKKKAKRPAAPPPPPMGSVVNTPQGRMVVTPQGMVPEHIYAQSVRSQVNPQMRMFGPPQMPQLGAPMPQMPQMPQMQQMPGQRGPQQRGPQQRGPQQRGPQQRGPQQRGPQQRMQGRPMPQQQLAPRRTSRPQDEMDAYVAQVGEQDEDQGDSMSDEQSTAAADDMVVAAPNIFEAEEQVAGAKEPLSGTAAMFIARALDEGLNDALEVDEFINAIKQRVPEDYLQDLVKYTAQEVVASVREHAPRSMALSPGGLEFTSAVMTRLRAMYGIA
jgi:hypothetical protein